MMPQLPLDADHPVSPAFAREAAGCLQRGEIAEALRLCHEGAERYPWYATAALVMGRCYEELGRSVEALLEYRRALAELPDSHTLQEAVARVERRERQEFEQFVEHQLLVLPAKPGTKTFEEFVGEALRISGPPAQERPSLRVARREEDEESVIEGVPTEPGASPEIVTVTLAEIYASQGQYAEAVSAYQKLLERRPKDAERFRKRIVELEALAAAADTETPLQE